MAEVSQGARSAFRAQSQFIWKANLSIKYLIHKGAILANTIWPLDLHILPSHENLELLLREKSSISIAKRKEWLHGAEEVWRE